MVLAFCRGVRSNIIVEIKSILGLSVRIRVFCNKILNTWCSGDTAYPAFPYRKLETIACSKRDVVIRCCYSRLISYMGSEGYIEDEISAVQCRPALEFLGVQEVKGMSTNLFLKKIYP